MEKILYATDLDGTLLRNDITPSPYTIRVVNDFIRAGGLFTYVTARSMISAGRITAPLALTLPVATYNGTFLQQPGTGERLWSCNIPSEIAQSALQTLLDAGVCPIVYAFIDGHERASWLPDRLSAGEQSYVDQRPGDPRNRPVETTGQLLAGDVFYMLSIGTQAHVERLAAVFAENAEVSIHTLEDSYRPGEFWFELSPRGAGKDKALEKLRELTGADRVVCFGDNLNDIPMFRHADEAYAVANAKPELHAIATAAIPANMEDGVARFLAQRAGMEPITTERLLLRRWETADAPDLIRIANNESILQWLPDWAEPEEWIPGWIERVKSQHSLDNPTGKFISWAIVERISGEIPSWRDISEFTPSAERISGEIPLWRDISELTPTAEKTPGKVVGQIVMGGGEMEDGSISIGYFMDPAFGGRGYMTEAVKALVQYAMDTYGYPDIHALVQPENHASRKVLQHAGFAYVTTVIQQLDYHPTPCPFEHWRITNK